MTRRMSAMAASAWTIAASNRCSAAAGSVRRSRVAAARVRVWLASCRPRPSCRSRRRRRRSSSRPSTSRSRARRRSSWRRTAPTATPSCPANAPSRRWSPGVQASPGRGLRSNWPTVSWPWTSGTTSGGPPGVP